jgi:hypothetical protein
MVNTLSGHHQRLRRLVCGLLYGHFYNLVKRDIFIRDRYSGIWKLSSLKKVPECSRCGKWKRELYECIDD